MHGQTESVNTGREWSLLGKCMLSLEPDSLERTYICSVEHICTFSLLDLLNDEILANTDAQNQFSERERDKFIWLATPATL